MEIKTCASGEMALRGLTEQLIALLAQKGNVPFHLALSGGETAKKMFHLWVDEYRDQIPFDRIRFYWVDERCVPPEDPESNYGQARKLLLDPLGIPSSHVFRIKGERRPEEEAIRYSFVVVKNLSLIYEETPVMDGIILGIGNDMHTASIFPDTPDLVSYPAYYGASCHPQTGQRRVTMTGRMILSGSPLLVPLVGPDKEPVFQALQRPYDPSVFLPGPYMLEYAAHATVYYGK